MERISVVIPVYKVEQYLERCVQSVLDQTHTNLEIILVDDGSPDQCGAMCDEFAKKDRRIRVIHQENRGLSGARNAGTDVATGDYIAYLDSDDYVDKTMYEQLLRVLKQYDADIAECGYRWVKPDRTLDRENTGTVDTYTNIEALEKLYFGDQMFGGLSIVVWNKLYRRELMDGLRFEQGLINEDVGFTPRIIYRAKRIAKLNLNLHNFYHSPNSISRSSYSIKNTDVIKIKKGLMQYYRQIGLQRYCDYIHAACVGDMQHNYYECRLRKKSEEFASCAKQLRKELKESYASIKNNPFAKEDMWRHRLFHFSPDIWFFVMRVGKKIKSWR